MENPAPSAPGPWGEHQQVYAAMTGISTAAQAECIKKARDSGDAAKSGLSWEDYCQSEFGIGRSQADRIVCYYEKFGPNFFRLREIANVGFNSFRSLNLAARIAGNAIVLDGQSVEIAPENAARLRVGIAAIRAEFKPPPKPAPRPAPAPPPVAPGSSPMLNRAEIETMLEDFHAAAARSDLAACRSFFAPGAQFIGLGRRDIIPGAEFQPGRWCFNRAVREVCLSPGVDFAWFWESMSTPAGDLYRSSGSFLRIGNRWKIALFHLSRIAPPSQP